MHCHNCGLTLSGFNRFRKGGGIIDLCYRCGFENPVIPELILISAKPVGTVGVLGELVEGDQFAFLRDLSKLYTIDGLDPSVDVMEIREEGKFRSQVIPYSKFSKEKVIVVEPEAQAVVGQKIAAVKYADILDALKEGLSIIAPAVAIAGVYDLSVAYETFKKVLENTLSQQTKSWVPGLAFGSKQAYLGRTPQGPSTEDPSTGSDFLAVSFKDLLDFIKDITPAVVSLAIEHNNTEPLQGLGKLVRIMRDFQSVNRSAVDRFPEDYDRELEEEYDYKKSPERAQTDLWS